jgi:ubiquinone/menaquinone biosynthesis C-methylase UbiE
VSRTHQHILHILGHELPNRKPDPTILDVGCGDGVLISKVSDQFECCSTGFDSSEYGLVHEASVGKQADTSVDIRVTRPDGGWPFDDESTDVVISNQVLEHVVDLEQFCAEAARVSRPGALGVHVFPTRHVVMEWHMFVPIAHRIRDHDSRAKVIELSSRAGLGVYRRQAVPLGVGVEQFAEEHADYLRTYTTYRTWRELADTFHRYGFRVTHRYTSMLLRTALGGSPKPLPPLAESLLFPLTRMVSSITLVTEFTQDYRYDWKENPS